MSTNHQAVAKAHGGGESKVRATFYAINSAGGDLKQTGQCDATILPNCVVRHSDSVLGNSGEFASAAPVPPNTRPGQAVIVTQSLSTALAVEQAHGFTAIAAMHANNLRAFAASLTDAGCHVTIVPDNSGLSRAAARAAARATGAKLATPPYKPSQSNLLEALSDSRASIRERFPAGLDPNHVAQTIANLSLRMAAEKAALVDLVVSPIADAKPWTPGMGRAEHIAQVSRAMSTGAEIGR